VRKNAGILAIGHGELRGAESALHLLAHGKTEPHGVTHPDAAQCMDQNHCDKQ
jgi:hypothetical protein